MPGEIAEAFVLIRPNTTGFKQEIEASARSSALGAAKIFAAAFAGVKLFDFAKSAVGEAAQVQKSTEGIKAGFGGASESVLKFADTSASQLGISKQASEAFSASLAIQARNLGISHDKAAEMATGLQQLAGSIGQIKGIDPASTFDKLSLSLLGNTRGLKQLGISADSASIAQAALDQGIVKATVNQAEVTKKTEEYRAAVQATRDAVDKYGKGSTEAAKAQNNQALAQQAVQKAVAGTVPKLDAAQKAQAIYAVATKQLGDFQKQAAQHSNDLTNQQQRLSAEWSNAKEQIGAALLPAVTSLTGELLHLLSAVEKDKGGFETAFHDIGVAITPVTFAIRELAHEADVTVPIIAALAGGFATYKVVSFAAREATALYNIALGAYRVTAAAASGQTDVLTSATIRQAVASGDVAAAEQARAAIAAEAATAIEAENVATSQAAVSLALYAAALEGGVSAQTGFALGSEALAAAQENLAVAEAAATAATAELDVALASNPFGLLALGVSAVVGGLIGYKALASESAAATDGLTQALKDAKQAQQDYADALDASKNAELDAKQAKLDNKQATQQVATDERHLTELRHNSKTTTAELHAAEQQLQTDRLNQQRTGLRVTETESRLADSRGKLRDVTKEMEKPVNDLIDAETKETRAAALRIQQIDRFKGPAKTQADLTKLNADAAERFREKLQIVTQQQLAQADALQRTNPLAAENARRQAALSLAAQDLAQKIGHIPTQHQVDVYYKRNIQDLIKQADELDRHVRDIVSNKSINVTTFFQAHGTPNPTAAGGPQQAGQLALTGERGPELSVSGVGRQVISHQESVSLLSDLSKAINRLVDTLTPREQKAGAARSGPLVETLNISEAGDAKATAQKVLDSLALAVPR